MIRTLAALTVAATTVGGLVLAAPPALVDGLERTAPAVVFAARVDRPVVALTIDDGPSEDTGEILRALAENGARATFFLIGSRIEAHSAEVERIVAAGHEIGNHTMEDAPSILLGRHELARQIAETDSLLSRWADPRWFRPGSGWTDGRVVEAAREAGYRVVLGSMWPIDPYLPWAPAVSRYVAWHARPGAILIVHDGPGRGAGTAATLRRLLPELRRRGYEVTTVSGLLAAEAAREGSR